MILVSLRVGAKKQNKNKKTTFFVFRIWEIEPRNAKKGDNCCVWIGCVPRSSNLSVCCVPFGQECPVYMVIVVGRRLSLAALNPNRVHERNKLCGENGVFFVETETGESRQCVTAS